MKKLLLIAVILLGSVCASAQSYNWGIGIRGGLSSADINVKHTLSSNAIEATFGLAWGNKGFRVSGLYEWTIPVITEGFTFYYGLGGNIGAYKEKTTTETGTDTKSGFIIGAMAVAGLEYGIPVIPLSIFLDYRPSINLGTSKLFDFRNVALGLRFCF